MVREDESSRLEVAVTGFEHGIQHRLVKEEVAHPFGNNDIELLYWQLRILQFSLDEGDSWGAKKCEYPKKGAWMIRDDILSLKPFASIIFTAWSIIFDMSICGIWGT
jgi:hypothetical protein